MENKRTSNFIFGIIAIILGCSLLKKFDFKNLTFEQPALAVVYIVVFIFSVYFLIKNSKKKSEK